MACLHTNRGGSSVVVVRRESPTATGRVKIYCTKKSGPGRLRLLLLLLHRRAQRRHLGRLVRRRLFLLVGLGHKALAWPVPPLRALTRANTAAGNPG